MVTRLDAVGREQRAGRRHDALARVVGVAAAPVGARAAPPCGAGLARGVHGRTVPPAGRVRCASGAVHSGRISMDIRPEPPPAYGRRMRSAASRALLAGATALAAPRRRLRRRRRRRRRRRPPTTTGADGGAAEPSGETLVARLLAPGRAGSRSPSPRRRASSRSTASTSTCGSSPTTSARSTPWPPASSTATPRRSTTRCSASPPAASR